MSTSIFNPTETEEKRYLEEVRERMEASIAEMVARVEDFRKEVQAQKQYLWENKAGMDHVEKISVRQSVNQTALSGEAIEARKSRIRKLMQTPWFGRIDFREEGRGETHPVYIGIHAYYDEKVRNNLVHDWRAPLSTVFYDYELGPAAYDAPGGKVEGEVSLKRQYRIRKGKMEYMLENALNIQDDILQMELSRASDERMKHIVASIQREQNAIIRDEEAPVLIIQGVAGSGKTSIALHRIAFLLYRFRESLSSEDILIISPNKVFADYISNVLPELGEERIPEMGMEELALALLEEKYRFQGFHQEINRMMLPREEAFRERCAFKSSFDFLHLLESFVNHIENTWFDPTDLVVKRYPVPAWFIGEQYKAMHRYPVFQRVNAIAEAVEQNVLKFYKYEITGRERNEIRSSIRKMFRLQNLRATYKAFFEWAAQPGAFKTVDRGAYEWADVFPLIYLKIRLEGYRYPRQVRHLLVDEMQDYSPVQYAVLHRLFACNKTILGDQYQRMAASDEAVADHILRVFPSGRVMKLHKSYRSTVQITRFAQRIRPDKEILPIVREGEEPELIHCRNQAEEMEVIGRLAGEFRAGSYHSMGIVCKTQEAADALFAELEGRGIQAVLLTPESLVFSQGIIVCAAQMAKGLEFDMVVVPGIGEKNYRSLMDRNMLYIACTRAMHQLKLSWTGKLTSFLQNS